MFKIHKTILGLLFLIAFSACEDDLFLAPISDRSTGDFYNDEEDFNQAIAGVYSALDYHSIYNFYLSDVRSDNIYIDGVESPREWTFISNMSINLSTLNIIKDAWNNAYVGVTRANTVLENLNVEAFETASAKNIIEGEAKFLRAIFYFDLVRFYGRVPIVDRLVAPEEALEISQSTPQEVYDLIIQDLTDAINFLPNTSDEGRASALAAKALLARVYLTMSGPTYGIVGPGINVDHNSEALTLLNEVIASNQFALQTDYASIFQLDSELNNEIIFAIQSINNTDANGVGTQLPAIMYHESWGRANLPFPGGIPSDALIVPSQQLINSFDINDTRKGFSILESWFDDLGTLNETPMIIKYLDLTGIPSDRFSFGSDFPIIRYADVLMMKAEALLNTNGSQSEIDNIINQIRSRAGVTTTISNANMDDLLEERRKEFFSEGSRFHDLVRTGKVIDVINDWIAVDDVSNVISAMEPNFIIYPLHQTQLEVKQGLYQQNPGYN